MSYYSVLGTDFENTKNIRNKAKPSLEKPTRRFKMGMLWVIDSTSLPETIMVTGLKQTEQAFDQVYNISIN